MIYNGLHRSRLTINSWSHYVNTPSHYTAITVFALFSAQCSKPVFMSLSDTESIFLDVALLLEILQGSPFQLMTIWANTVHS